MIKFTSRSGGEFFVPEQRIVTIYTDEIGELRLISVDPNGDNQDRPVASFEVLKPGVKYS